MELELLPGIRPLIGMALVALMLAGCAGSSTTTSAPATTSQPMPVARTPEQIRGDCWMKYEGDQKINLDKRAALVDACIAERSRSGVPVN
jgi:uncharacterized lipoprotein YbaY